MARDMQEAKDHADILRSLGKIEGQLESLLKSLEEHKAKSAEQETRIQAIEKKINYAAGAIAVLTVVVSFGWDIVRGLLRG